MNADLEMFCHRLLGALLNGGYQGFLLTAVIWLGLKFHPRANAATRHMVWLITLLFVAVLPAVHFLLPKTGEQRVESPEDPVLRSDNIEGTAPVDLLQHSRSEAMFDSSQETILKEDVVAETAASSKSNWDQSVRPTYVLPLIPENWQLNLPNGAGVALVGLWVAVALLRLGNLGRQSRRLRSLKRHATMAPDGLRTVFQTLSLEMGIKRKTHLLTCPESATPMAVGFRCPVVLLPAKMFDGAQALQLEQVLRHELAHFSRGDDWTNLIQQTIKAVLFFHPAVWWLSTRLTIEREIACDDHVLAATRTPRSYALFLTEFASRRQCTNVAVAPAAWSNKHQLTERITMILDSNRNASPRLARARVGVLTTAAALTALLVLHAGPRLVLAADERTDTDRADVAIMTETANVSDVTAVAELATETTIEVEAPPLAPVLAATDVPTPPAAPIESGPRAKRVPPLAPLAEEVPAPAKSLKRPPALINPPVMAQPAIVKTRPAVSVAAAATSVDQVAQSTSVAQPVPAKPRKSGDDSIERRLERLERMVESLLAREKGKKQIEAEHDFKFNMKGPSIDFPNDKFNKLIDKEKFAKLAEDSAKMAEKFAKSGLNEKELARIHEQASRDVERAAREVEKAARDIERTASENTNRTKVDDNRAQRQELEAKRRSLEKQMQALQRQIERLAEEQENLDPKSADREKKLKQPEKDTDSSKPVKPNDEDKPKAKR
jgi:beta-lactamase regulating signal transducer with metallopeptidase domain